MELVIIGAIALLAWLGVEIARFQDEVAKTTLERWSDEERVTLVRAERRWLDTGPFAVLLAGDLPVFEVTVRSTGGKERAGLLRCGRFPLGVLDPHVEVHWRAEAGATPPVAAQSVAARSVAAQPSAAQVGRTPPR